jgi:tRNA pseudouridine38-40 synthase
LRNFRYSSSACDSRIYEYLLPSYCLLPPQSSDPLSKLLDRTSPGWRDALGSAGEFADAGTLITEEEGKVPTEGEGIEGGQTTRREFERRRGWRVDEATLERFKALIAQFEGSQ